MQSFFWVGFIVQIVGSLLDIISSLSFEKFRTSNAYMKEGNFRLGGIWQDKNGNLAEKRAVAAMIVVAAVMLFLFCVTSIDFHPALGMFGLIIGILRAVFALKNWNMKAKLTKLMKAEQAAKVAAEQARLEELRLSSATVTNSPAAGFVNRNKGGSGGEW